MKKWITVLLALALVLSLAACGEKEETQQAGMPNPMQSVASLEELGEKGNFAVARPEGVALENEAYTLISGEPQIAEYSFNVDGVECFLRFADVSTATDISGIYVDGRTIFQDLEGDDYYIENDSLKAHRWATVDGQYLLVAQDGGAMDWTVFDGIYTQFKDLEPRTWSAAVPYAEYKALEGYYDDADEIAVGAVNIVFDHAGLFVIVDQPDGSRTWWEMNAVLEGGKLVYEKETVSSIHYDENAGSTVTTELPDGPAGYVEVQGDTLVFTGAGSEELQGLVLTKR